MSIQLLTRDFTVAVFVVWRECILLHKHPKLGIWLPPGGHIESNELPEEAAIRETLEESGVAIALQGTTGLDVKQPRQLLRPEGIQLESILPDHEHIDLIYFGHPLEPYEGNVSVDDGCMCWYHHRDFEALPLSQEVRSWCNKALVSTNPSS